jgi:hypothetical protein
LLDRCSYLLSQTISPNLFTLDKIIYHVFYKFIETLMCISAYMCTYHMLYHILYVCISIYTYEFIYVFLCAYKTNLCVMIANIKKSLNGIGHRMTTSKLSSLLHFLLLKLKICYHHVTEILVTLSISLILLLFLNLFIFLLCWVGVHYGIYKVLSIYKIYFT